MLFIQRRTRSHTMWFLSVKMIKTDMKFPMSVRRIILQQTFHTMVRKVCRIHVKAFRRFSSNHSPVAGIPCPVIANAGFKDASFSTDDFAAFQSVVK